MNLPIERINTKRIYLAADFSIIVIAAFVSVVVVTLLLLLRFVDLVLPIFGCCCWCYIVAAATSAALLDPNDIFHKRLASFIDTQAGNHVLGR